MGKRQGCVRHGRRAFRSFARKDSGQSLVEFALLVPLLLFLFFGVFEFGRFYWTRLALRHSVREATRFAVTGNVLPDSLGNPMTRSQSIAYLLQTSSPDLHISAANISMTPANGGGPGDIVRVNVRYEYVALFPFVSAVFPNGRAVLNVSTVMKNEKF